MSRRIGNPRKKRRVYVSREPPFPVPIATITGETANDKTWFYYTGEFHGSHVVVRHSGDVDFLYKMGFFGKGSLSKSKPDFNSRARTVNIPDASGETTRVKLANRRSYIRHMKWKRLEMQHAGGEISPDDLVEYDSSLEVSIQDEEMSTKDELVAGDKEMNEQPSPLRTLSVGPTVAANWKDTDEEFWSSPAENLKRNFQSSSKEDWAETDEDFWGSAPSGQSESKHTDHANSIENEIDARLPSKSEGADVNNVIIAETESRLCCNNNTSLESESSGANNITVESESKINENYSEPLPLDRRKKSDENIFVNETHESGNQSDVDNQGCNVPEICSSSHDVGEDLEKGVEKEPDLPLDQLCEEDEDEGDVLVVEDSDSDTEGRYRKLSKQRWLPVLKKDAYPLKEFLHLSLEEAFFLSYGLGCLIVKENGKTLDLSTMWMRFCEAQQNFLPNYVVYHYFRSLGWVPKSGLKFGTDFILYKVGPPFYHGSYSVVVKTINEEEVNAVPEVTGVEGRDFSWISLAGLNRVTEQVAKELMLCYVIRPSDLTTEELKSPKCLSRFKVQQITVNRWIPSQERQEKFVEEMP
ncbi:tRNA-splicing endonuclease subunit Sen2-like [Mizuhopecten yessoensis]|uniref:tRNA-intron lyase n=1 Tax=Mizuhopecten yessoensis TaxID=6573 RepID=A0A210PQS6_MIZYE|nr:tRNA-splicing endonuclease subunit Sen2-like [Mizuhopecten yessoensis]OWF38859.1 tRNA-splicing endonuclease subunit Sen2 [Mizuhopecten yessoensis]